MTIFSLNNNYSEIYNDGFEALTKAKALIDLVLLINNLSDISPQIMHDYLWGLSDFIKKVKSAYEALEP